MLRLYCACGVHLAAAKYPKQPENLMGDVPTLPVAPFPSIDAVSLRKTARRLGVSRHKLDRLLALGQLAGVFVDGELRITGASIEAYEAARDAAAVPASSAA